MTDFALRPLKPADLGAVVALDARAGRSAPRRGYFERRLASALRDPARHLQAAAWSGDALVGFMLARRAGGEYGGTEDEVVLEAFGVDEHARHNGAASRLLGRIEDLAREKGAASVTTQAAWREAEILGFLRAEKFELSPRRLFELPVHRHDEGERSPPPLVRVLHAGDLPALLRIDERITKRARGEYLRHRLDEALHESAVAVSLAAEDDGFVVGFAIARVDAGDFGQLQPRASLDTIGVDPRFAGRGIGAALLAQMLDDLAALRVERLQTELLPEAVDLQSFLLRFGVVHSQGLALRKLL